MDLRSQDRVLCLPPTACDLSTSLCLSTPEHPPWSELELTEPSIQMQTSAGPRYREKYFPWRTSGSELRGSPGTGCVHCAGWLPHEPRGHVLTAGPLPPSHPVALDRRDWTAEARFTERAPAATEPPCVPRWTAGYTWQSPTQWRPFKGSS